MLSQKAQSKHNNASDVSKALQIEYKKVNAYITIATITNSDGQVRRRALWTVPPRSGDEQSK